MKQSVHKNTASERVPWHAAMIVALAVAGTGCVRQVVSNRPGGGFAWGRPAQTTTVPAHTQQAGSKNTPAEGSVTAILNQQTRGAFNPLTDDAAVRQLEARLRLDAHDLAARLELAAIYERYGLPEQAFDQYQRALHDSTETSASNQPSVPGASSATRVEPEAEAAATGLARAARAVGRVSDAIPPIAAFLQTSPASVAWNELGMLYDDAGDFALAERSFREAVATHPKLDPPHNNLGYNLLLQNKLEEAEAEFRRALELNPLSAAARNNLAVVLARRGDRDAAFAQFRLAASDDATAHNNLAVVLLEMGYLEKSRDELLLALTARYYFAPPMQNYKLVQDLLEKRAQLLEAGDALPLSLPRISPALAAATGRLELNRVPFTLEEVRRTPQPEGGVESKVSKVSEDRP
jgi:Flp pilus assembly protein TadD